MPTGPFSSLAQITEVQFPTDSERVPHTAKEIIDEATRRSVRLFIDKPEKTHLFFSVDPHDPPKSVTIGLAIFRGIVGEHVQTYISECIEKVPFMVREARRNGIRP
jgi:hypothetical protein